MVTKDGNLCNQSCCIAKICDFDLTDVGLHPGGYSSPTFNNSVPFSSDQFQTNTSDSPPHAVTGSINP